MIWNEITFLECIYKFIYLAFFAKVETKYLLGLHVEKSDDDGVPASDYQFIHQYAVCAYT